MYTIVVKSEDSLDEFYQIDLFYDSTTEEVVDMGTTEIPQTQVVEEVEEETFETCEPVPVEEWTSNPQVDSVITVVQQSSKITTVSEVKKIHTQLTTTYEVSGEGITVTLVVDEETQDIEVIDEEIIAPVPV